MPTATMGVSSVDRLARSKRPTVERTEIHIPPAPVFPVEAVTGDPRMRAQAVAAFNNALQKWRNDAWSIEAPFVPDAELQADVATLEDTMAKLVTKLDRAAVDIRRAEASITTISTNVTNIDNSITTINNQITVIESNSITGTGIVQANGTNPTTAILGSTGHFPYWQPTDPHLSATSPLYTDGTNVGIATTTPGVLFDIGLSGTTAGVMRLAGSTSGNVTINTAAAAGSWTLTLPTTDGAANEFLKTDGTGVTSWSSVVLTTDVTGLLPTANGGTNHGLWTAGSVIFAGAGGLLLTEDNANLFWDNANNRLGVGTAVPVTELSVVSTSASDPRGIMSAQYSTDAVGARLHFRKARGTEALPTTVVTGDVLGRIRFSGYDGANYLQMGSIDAVTFGTVAATRVPVDLVFSTAADVAPSVLTERMRIKGAGGVQIPRDTSFQSLTAGSAIVILATYTSASGENTLGSLTNANKTHIGFSGGLTVLGTGSVGIGVSSPSNRLHLHINDAVTTVTDVLRINHANTAGTSANFGTGIIITGKSSTTDNQHMARIQTIWTDATDATRTSALQFQTVNSAAALATRMSLSGAGGLSVGDATTTTAVGVINAVTGYRIASAAATSGTYLRGNGTNFVGSVISPSDITYAFTEGSVLFAGPGGTTIAQDNANFFWDNTNNFLGLGTAVPLVLLHLNTAGFNDTSILFENANGYAAIELDGPTGDFKVASLFGELQFVAGNQVHLSMDGVGNTLVVSGLGTISGYFSATGNVGIGTNATAPGALLDIGLAGTTLGVMRMAGSTSGNVTIQAQAIAGTWTLQLPIDDGAAGSILTSNGSGVSAWTTVLPIANGGTNTALSLTSNSIVYSNGTSYVHTDTNFTFVAAVSLLSLVRNTNASWDATFMTNADLTANANAAIQMAFQLYATDGTPLTQRVIYGKEQTWTAVATTHDGYFEIQTLLNGTATSALGLRSSGSVICGKDSTGTTRTDDFTYICQTNGVPTGVPTAFGNRVAMTFDPNTDTFYIYRGGWKGVVVV